jgi:hypothetical protein
VPEPRHWLPSRLDAGQLAGWYITAVAVKPIWASSWAQALTVPAIVIAGGWLMLTPHRRNDWRRLMGRCVACGYDLTGNVSGVCPECGTAKV